MTNFEPRKHDDDHDSDPAHTPGDGWVSEGGASHLGPATHTESGHAERTDPEAEASGSEEPEAE